MYTQQDRTTFSNLIIEFIMNTPEIEGALQIGSGATGYKDIYSDVDFMAGCYDETNLQNLHRKVISFFEKIGSIYISKREWSKNCLGVSCYFENGLSCDFSYMPTKEMIICYPVWNCVVSKSDGFLDYVNNDTKNCIDYDKNFKLSETTNHDFIYNLRRCLIALKRHSIIYAEIALSEARNILYKIEMINENKKIHQFKDYNTFSQDFLLEAYKTYPNDLTEKNILNAVDCLLKLYINTVNKCKHISIDNVQLLLIKYLQE